MGASVPLSKESPITNTSWAFLVALVLMHVGAGSRLHGWLFLDLVRYSCDLCSPNLERHISYVGALQRKVLPSALSRDKGPVSFIFRVICVSQLKAEFRLISPLHSLEVGLSLSLGQHTVPHIYLLLTL